MSDRKPVEGTSAKEDQHEIKDEYPPRQTDKDETPTYQFRDWAAF